MHSESARRPTATRVHAHEGLLSLLLLAFPSAPRTLAPRTCTRAPRVPPRLRTRSMRRPTSTRRCTSVCALPQVGHAPSSPIS